MRADLIGRPTDTGGHGPGRSPANLNPASVLGTHTLLKRDGVCARSLPKNRCAIPLASGVLMAHQMGHVK